jgi:hypothetical protein
MRPALGLPGKKIPAPLGAARRELSPQGLSPDGSKCDWHSGIRASGGLGERKVATETTNYASVFEVGKCCLTNMRCMAKIV